MPCPGATGILAGMSIEGEAAGDAVTGAVIARAVDGPGAHPRAQEQPHGACRNCGAALAGPFCSACGQPAHIHRSLSSLGHDILHGVFHFEGKVWRTLPELFFHPGRLTRRYIDGERVKFVSPMALYLFTVFFMYAIFAFTGGLFTSGDQINDVIEGNPVAPRDFKSGARAAMVETDKEIAALRAKLSAPDVTAQQRADLEREIAALESARTGMEVIAAGDWARLTVSDDADSSGNQGSSERSTFKLGWPALEKKLAAGLEGVESNPQLLLYKLKTNGYKFSWALVPLSIPFMWLLFFWRRDVHLYDHAIFVTYSITFIMLLVVIVTVLATLGTPGAIWGTMLALVPVHMYKQLRGTYGLSRFGAFVRLILLLLSAAIVLTIFNVSLVLLGVLG